MSAGQLPVYAAWFTPNCALTRSCAETPGWQLSFFLIWLFFSFSSLTFPVLSMVALIVAVPVTFRLLTMVAVPPGFWRFLSGSKYQIVSPPHFLPLMWRETALL